MEIPLKFLFFFLSCFSLLNIASAFRLKRWLLKLRHQEHTLDSNKRKKKRTNRKRIQLGAPFNDFHLDLSSQRSPLSSKEAREGSIIAEHIVTYNKIRALYQGEWGKEEGNGISNWSPSLSWLLKTVLYFMI